MSNNKLKKASVAVIVTVLATFMVVGNAFALSVAPSGANVTKSKFFSGVSVTHHHGRTEAVIPSKAQTATISSTGTFADYRVADPAGFERALNNKGYYYKVSYTIGGGVAAGRVAQNAPTGTYGVKLYVGGTAVTGQDGNGTYSIGWIGKDKSKSISIEKK